MFGPNGLMRMSSTMTVMLELMSLRPDLTRARGMQQQAHKPTKDGGRLQELLHVPSSSMVGVYVYVCMCVCVCAYVRMCVCASVLDSQSSQRLEQAHCQHGHATSRPIVRRRLTNYMSLGAAVGEMPAYLLTSRSSLLVVRHLGYLAGAMSQDVGD